MVARHRLSIQAGNSPGRIYAYSCGIGFVCPVVRSSFRSKRTWHCGLLSLRMRALRSADHHPFPIVHHGLPESGRRHERDWRPVCGRHRFHVVGGVRQYGRGLHRASLVFRRSVPRYNAAFGRSSDREPSCSSAEDAADGIRGKVARRDGSDPGVDIFQLGTANRRPRRNGQGWERSGRTLIHE